MPLLMAVIVFVKMTSVSFASEPFGLFLGNQFRISSSVQRRQVAYLYPS